MVAQVESSREWTVSEAERCWYEALLFMAQPLEELMVRVCSLKADVPLSPEEPSAPEQFLQTRTVSLEEARRELWEWLEPAGRRWLPWSRQLVL